MTSNRERFEAWYLAEFWEGSNCGRAMLKKEHCGGYTYAKPQELWKVWQAAQPAAGEPVAYAAFADNGNIQMWCKAGIDVARIFESTGKKPFPVYAAPPAAPHGDEMDRDEVQMQCLRDLYESGYNDGQNNPNGYSSISQREDAAQHTLRDMRAQAGEGGEA